MLITEKLVRVLEKGHYPVRFDTMLEYIEENESYKVVPLTIRIVKIIRDFQNIDLHDRVIMATALITDSVLVSKDKEIGVSGLNVICSRRDSTFPDSY